MIATSSNSTTYYYGAGACFCHKAPATRDGRCEYHAGMWDMFRAFEEQLEYRRKPLGTATPGEVVLEQMDTGHLCMEHFLFCEGFPEYEDW